MIRLICTCAHISDYKGFLNSKRCIRLFLGMCVCHVCIHRYDFEPCLGDTWGYRAGLVSLYNGAVGSAQPFFMFLA